MAPTALNEQSSESSGSNSMTRKHFLSLMKCEQCFLDLKEEFLYSNPGKEKLFDNIKKISENDFNEVVEYASGVLEGSEHPAIVYPGEFDQDENYMKIVGLKGCYMAFNNDVKIFFDTLKFARKYADEGFEEFQNNVWSKS